MNHKTSTKIARKETTPQQDIRAILSVISPGGTIKVERYAPGMKRFRGATMRDSDLLYKCNAPRYFGEDQWDDILETVSNCGFGLECEEDESEGVK